jgi:hypothetical protein
LPLITEGSPLYETVVDRVTRLPSVTE